MVNLRHARALSVALAFLFIAVAPISLACLTYSGTRVEPTLPTCRGDPRGRGIAEPIDRWPVLENEVVVAEEMAKVWPARPTTILHAHIGVDETGTPTCATLRDAPADGRVTLAARAAIERMRFSPAQAAGAPVRAWTHLTLRTYLDGDGEACDAGVGFACAAHGYRAHDEGRLDDAQRSLDRACTLGEVDACRSLGALRAERGDHVAAAAVWQRACDAGSLGACVSLGRAYEGGRGLSRDVARASTLYERACLGKNAWGCNNLAILVARGVGVAKDPERALALFEEACVFGSSYACGSAGQRLIEGRAVPRDEVRGKKWFARGCTMGHAASCNHLGKVAGREGRDAESMRLLERGCELDPTHCTHLLTLLRTRDEYAQRAAEIGPRTWRAALAQCEDNEPDEIACNYASVIARCGYGVESDVPRAATLAARACNDVRLRPEACLAEGRARSRMGEGARAEALFARACALDIGDACDALAAVVEERDTVAALAHWERGCALGSATACARVAERQWARDPTRARTLAVEACRRQDGTACRLLALAEPDDGTPFATVRVAAQLRRACSWGDAPACRALAACYRSGDGVAPSEAQAAKLEERARRIDVDAECFSL